MVKLLIVSGSPVEGSSTDILLGAIGDSIVEALGAESVERAFIRLNDVSFVPCQACGKAPTPDYCFFNDELTPLYKDVSECDCLLLGSPIYFDAVSAQTKAFIDRCNCVRPADFDNNDPDHNFIRLLKNKRPGAMVLVGGEKGWFEGARRSIAGFFKWIEVVNEGHLIFHSRDFNKTGEAADDAAVLDQARQMGRRIAVKIRNGYDRPGN